MATQAALSQAQIDELARLYTFTNPAEIVAFLEQYPDLVPLLMEAHGKIGEYFPGDPAHLQYVVDPEDEALNHLGVYIVTALDDDAADRVLDRFDDDDAWLVQAPFSLQEKILIDLRGPEEMTG